MGEGVSQCYTQPTGGGGREQGVWGGGWLSQCYTQPAGGGQSRLYGGGLSQCYTQPAGGGREQAV